MDATSSAPRDRAAAPRAQGAVSAGRLPAESKAEAARQLRPAMQPGATACPCRAAVSRRLRCVASPARRDVDPRHVRSPDSERVAALLDERQLTDREPRIDGSDEPTVRA